MLSNVTIEQKLDHATLRQPLPRSAFKNTAVYRVELRPRMSLYKLTHAGGVSPSGAISLDRAGWVTPWWFSYESLVVRDARYGTISIRGVADVAENASRTKGSFRDFLRARGAVCHDWNVMTHLLIVELTRPIIGLMGTCSGQPVYDNVGLRAKEDAQNISFIGGEQQFYLQGLRRPDVIVSKSGPIE